MSTVSCVLPVFIKIEAVYIVELSWIVDPKIPMLTSYQHGAVFNSCQTVGISQFVRVNALDSYNRHAYLQT